MKLLLKHGAKIDARTRDGTTATLAACDGGHTAVVSLLLSYNPDITAKVCIHTLFYNGASSFNPSIATLTPDHLIA